MMDTSQPVVSIDTQRQGDTMLIRPHLRSSTPLTLRYRMTVRRSSTNGTSSINQSGDLQSDSAGSLISLTMPAGASCQVQLEVFQNDRLVQQVESDCAD